jgi:hypothetical protein
LQLEKQRMQSINQLVVMFSYVFFAAACIVLWIFYDGRNDVARANATGALPHAPVFEL